MFSPIKLLGDFYFIKFCKVWLVFCKVLGKLRKGPFTTVFGTSAVWFRYFLFLPVGPLELSRVKRKTLVFETWLKLSCFLKFELITFVGAFVFVVDSLPVVVCMLVQTKGRRN